MSETPETEISESDPNADSPEGLAGDMGVSSERKGTVRGGAEEVTYAAAPTHTDEEPEGETPPEQSAFDPRPDVHPDNDVGRPRAQPRRQPGAPGPAPAADPASASTASAPPRGGATTRVEEVAGVVEPCDLGLRAARATSVARASSACSPAAAPGQRNDHRVQASRRSSSLTGVQVVPSTLTSTLRIGPAPLHERPCSTRPPRRGSTAPSASSQALRTGLVVSGGLSAGQSPPVIRYHLVFHGEVSGELDTSRDPSHLMLAMPTQPGTTRRSGKPWSGSSVRPLAPHASRASSSALPTGIGRRTGP